MKKILALILSVIMLLSVMPVAYAQRATYPPELEQYIDFWIRVESYRNNKYESEADRDELFKIFSDFADKLFNSGLDDIPLGDTGIIWYRDIYNQNIDMEQISCFNEVMQPAIDDIEAKIASGEIGVILNSYEVWKLLGDMHAYYDDVLIDKTGLEIQTTNSEFYQNYISESEKYDSIDEPYYYDNQAEYDAVVNTVFRPFFEMLINCLDGNHPYGEYISNNDATEEADGTKTATCEFCGATDTVVDEGSKLVKEPASFFEMLIAMIKAFFEKIFSIFG